MIAPAHFSTLTLSDRTTTARAARLAASREEAVHDVALVRRVNSGDESAFIEITHRYRARLFALALGMLKNHADAEEVAQDTFIRAHRALAKFRGDSSLATWLHRIALNLARNRYWYLFRRRQNVTCSLDQPAYEHSETTVAEQVASDAAGPVREATASEFTEIVATCMARLEQGPRTILALRTVQNLSYEKIAAVLGINIGTVKSRIARAREMLRVLLTEACPEFGVDAQPEAWFESLRPVSGVGILGG